MKGSYCKEEFKVGTDEFSRYLDIKQTFIDITGVDKNNGFKTFESDYSGYIGIAPWTANEKEKEYNFMWQLKQAGLIDHLTMSFYIHLEDSPNKYASSIKFGSFDVDSISSG